MVITYHMMEVRLHIVVVPTLVVAICRIVHESGIQITALCALIVIYRSTITIADVANGAIRQSLYFKLILTMWTIKIVFHSIKYYFY